MKTTSLRHLRSLFVALCFSTAPALAACTAGPDRAAETSPDQEVLVTPPDVEALEPGEELVADLRLVAYRFDGSLEERHFERIRLIAADGSSMLMTDWLAHVKAKTGHELPEGDITLRGSMEELQSAPSTDDEIGQAQQEMRKIMCSGDGCLCFDCYYTSSGDLIQCDAYWFCD